MYRITNKKQNWSKREENAGGGGESQKLVHDHALAN